MSRLSGICWKPVNQAELSWGMCACPWMLFPQPGPQCTCSLMTTYAEASLCCLLREYICFIAYFLVQNKPVKTWYNSLLYSATEEYTVMSLASSGNWYLIPKNCHWDSCVGDVCGLLGRNQKWTFMKKLAAAFGNEWAWI